MTERDEKDLLASEYVLGTLDEGERAEVAARRQRESDLDRSIGEWEERLAPLLAHVDEATPREDLLERIQERIAEGDSADRATAGAVADLTALQRRVSRWRGIALAASTLAAGLAAFIVYGEAVRPPVQQQFIAVFQDGDKPPRFIMSINLKTRELTVRPVAAELPEGKTFQLWIKADPLGPDPKSLGLLDTPESPTRKQLDQFDPKLLQNATFGISLEEAGGSKTGKPSPGALHGKLIPASL